MLLSFIIGAIAGVVGMWFFYTGNRKAIKVIREEKQRIEQEKRIVVEFMHNMVEAAGEGTSREALFQRIIHAAILSTGATSACIYEKLKSGKLKGVAVEGLFPPQRPVAEDTRKKLSTRARFLEGILKSETFAPGEGIIGEVAQSRDALLIRDAATDPRIVHHDDPALRLASIIVSPILFQDELIGVLAVANPADGEAFNDTDFSLVESLAEQVGMAVHNSDLVRMQIEKSRLDVDLELAGSVQGLLLPDRFPLPGQVDIAASYRPAQKISGDLYDAFDLGGNRIGIAIADVSGKGISASILMAICHTNLRHFARHMDSPADVLRAVNAAMQHSIRPDMFITMVYAVIDLESGSLSLARAGHEPPLLIGRDESNEAYRISRLRPNGMALGMVPPAIFDPIIEDEALPFRPGDTLVAYTDGLTESVNPAGQEYSGERLEDALKPMASSGAHDIVNSVVESVARFAGQSQQNDDLTLIVVKRS